MLPTFLGLGAQRCGTTWLYECLHEHPQIYMPDIKEINFFNDINTHNYQNGLLWYESFFKKALNGQKIGEITPEYLLDPRVPLRIKKTLDEPKLIVILRSPIDRILSSWGKGLREDHWDCSFEEFINKNIDFCIDRGFYYQSIQRYLRVFNKNLIKICIYEDIIIDPLLFLQDIYHFLNVNASYIPGVLNNKFNIGLQRKKKSIKYIRKVRDVIYDIPYLDKTIKIAERNKILNFFMRLLLRSEKTILKDDLVHHLINIYQEDTDNLSNLVKRDLNKEWFGNYQLIK